MSTKKPRLQPLHIVFMRKKDVLKVGRVIIGCAPSGKSANQINRPVQTPPKLTRFSAITAENVDRTP